MKTVMSFVSDAATTLLQTKSFEKIWNLSKIFYFSSFPQEKENSVEAKYVIKHSDVVIVT